MRAKRGGKTKYVLLVVLLLWLVLVLAGYFSRYHVAVLDPAGTVAAKERDLIFLALALCAIVVVPVFVLAIGIAWRYREGAHKNAKYQPNWDGNRWMEGTWWAIPLAIITVLAIVAWNSSYSLDPYRALATKQPPLNVQVVALDWKWLFIYPDQRVASVNSLELPQNRPVNFRITSDSVMNSFWIPSLGSQIYAMPGMDTQLHLLPTKPGVYHGASANISGQGFADMNFSVTVGDAAEFNSWVQAIKNGGVDLDRTTYQTLKRPSQNNPAQFYSLVDSNLYNNIVTGYMAPIDGMGGERHD